ncbi:MAG: ATPase domain-containing protein [Betaproteobacteria bacterium]
MAKRRVQQSSKDTTEIVRISTGVPGLDTLLGGGFLEGGLYLIEGMAGTGKTILSSQICFTQVQQGGNVLYVTLIAESHVKLVQHLRGMSYFDPDTLAKSFILISGYDPLSTGGLKAFLELIVRSVRKHRPAFMVIDGFRATNELQARPGALPEFIHQLNTFITGVRCTTVLLAPFSGNDPRPEHTLVDGLIELNHYASGMRRAREIEVHKIRASHHMQGRHTFEITNDGVVIYPRLEALHVEPVSASRRSAARMRFGIPSFDRILGGGVMAGSATSVLGPPGTAKTLLGLQFLEAGIRGRERSLYCGFYEPPEGLIRKAAAVGIELNAALKSGALQIIWQPPVERSLDQWGYALLETVRANKISRLFIDGIERVRDVTLHPERFALFIAALCNQLRALNATTLFSEETALYGEQINHTASAITAVIDNMIVLRHVELRSQSYRLISILKLREGGYDNAIHEFSISAEGLLVTASSQSAEDILTGKGATTPKPPDSPSRSAGKMSAAHGARRRRK